MAVLVTVSLLTTNDLSLPSKETCDENEGLPPWECIMIALCCVVIVIFCSSRFVSWLGTNLGKRTNAKQECENYIVVYIVGVYPVTYSTIVSQYIIWVNRWVSDFRLLLQKVRFLCSTIPQCGQIRLNGKGSTVIICVAIDYTPPVNNDIYHSYKYIVVLDTSSTTPSKIVWC